MHEQARGVQIGKMLNAKLFSFSRWVQRIRKQNKSRHKVVFRGAEHRRLSSTIRVTAQKNPSRDNLV